jgi:hypothetical protein
MGKAAAEACFFHKKGKALKQSVLNIKSSGIKNKYLWKTLPAENTKTPVLPSFHRVAKNIPRVCGNWGNRERFHSCPQE